MQTPYHFIQTDYSTALKALNHFTEDMLAPSTDAVGTLNRDLPRTSFIQTGQQNREQFNQQLRGAVGQHRCYLQGDLDGSVFKFALLKSARFQKAAQDKSNKEMNAFAESDSNGLRIAFFDDTNVPCGLSILYLKNEPTHFLISLVKDTDRAPKERQVFIYSHNELLNYQNRAQIQPSNIDLPDLKSHMLEALNCEILRSGLSNLIDDKQRLNINTLNRFKQCYQLLPPKQLKPTPFDFFKTDYHYKAQLKLALLAKLSLEPQDYQRFKQYVLLQLEPSVLEKYAQVAEGFLPSPKRSRLKDQVNLIIKRQNYLDVNLTQLKTPSAYAYFSRPYYRRYQASLITIGLSLLLGAASIGLCLCAVVSPLGVGLITLAAMGAVASLGFLSGFGLWVKQHSEERSILRPLTKAYQDYQQTKALAQESLIDDFSHDDLSAVKHYLMNLLPQAKPPAPNQEERETIQEDYFPSPSRG